MNTKKQLDTFETFCKQIILNILIIMTMQESRTVTQEPIYEEIENEYALANQSANHTYVLPNFTDVYNNQPNQQLSHNADQLNLKKRNNRGRLIIFISIVAILFILISAGILLGVLGGSRFSNFLNEALFFN